MNKFNKLIILLLALTSCSGSTSKQLKLSVLSPTGAPSLAFYNYPTDAKFETNSNPQNIVAEMSSGNKDIIVLPTNAGIASINKGAPYKIASTITFGNFFLAATGNDEDKTLNEGDNVILFQQNGIPDKVFSYLFKDELTSFNIKYANAVSDAAACLINNGQFSDKDESTFVADYVLIAEPALTNALAKNTKASLYLNIQEKFKEKTGGKELFQASIFVSNKADKKLVNSFLASLEKDIKTVLENGDLFLEKLDVLTKEEQTVKYGVASKIAASVTKKNNGLGLGYKTAFDNKGAIDTFLSIFGLNETTEEIYYK